MIRTESGAAAACQRAEGGGGAPHRPLRIAP
jgi:hypothetical protein